MSNESVSREPSSRQSNKSYYYYCYSKGPNKNQPTNHWTNHPELLRTCASSWRSRWMVKSRIFKCRSWSEKGRAWNKSGDIVRQRPNNCFVVNEPRTCTRDWDCDCDVDTATISSVSDGSDDGDDSWLSDPWPMVLDDADFFTIDCCKSEACDKDSLLLRFLLTTLSQQIERSWFSMRVHCSEWIRCPNMVRRIGTACMLYVWALRFAKKQSRTCHMLSLIRAPRCCSDLLNDNLASYKNREE